MIGPFLLGSHVTIWILYAIFAISNTAHAHSGWHLPFLTSSEGHDYHHLTTYVMLFACIYYIYI